MRPQTATDNSDVTRKSHPLIVLVYALLFIYALHIPEQCWLPNVNFVRNDDLFIELWVSIFCHVAGTQNRYKESCLDNLSFCFLFATFPCIPVVTSKGLPPMRLIGCYSVSSLYIKFTVELSHIANQMSHCRWCPTPSLDLAIQAMTVNQC